MLNVAQLAQRNGYLLTLRVASQMWSGGEPSEGVFNDTYYSITTGIINDLAAHGMHSLLDMHQDCASSEFCLYDGLPRWLIDKRRRATHAFPWPFNATDPPCQRFWEDNCLTEDAGVAYQSLYDNVNGMADAMAAFWRESASRFRDLTSVLGYELINEPFAGDVYADPLLFLPALAGKQNLLPLYDNVTRAIRAVDDETLVFYEPVTWGKLFCRRFAVSAAIKQLWLTSSATVFLAPSTRAGMFLSGEVIGSGFSRVPLSAAEAERSVLSYHYYCPTFPANQSAPYPPFNRFLCDELMGPSVCVALRAFDCVVRARAHWVLFSPRQLQVRGKGHRADGRRVDAHGVRVPGGVRDDGRRRGAVDSGRNGRGAAELHVLGPRERHPLLRRQRQRAGVPRQGVRAPVRAGVRGGAAERGVQRDDGPELPRVLDVEHKRRCAHRVVRAAQRAVPRGRGRDHHAEREGGGDRRQRVQHRAGAVGAHRRGGVRVRCAPVAARCAAAW